MSPGRRGRAPITMAGGAAGLAERGPRMLNTVRTARARRTGPTAAIAGWKKGANRKVKPVLSKRRRTWASSMGIGRPSASSTSALPPGWSSSGSRV